MRYRVEKHLVLPTEVRRYIHLHTDDQVAAKSLARALEGTVFDNRESRAWTPQSGCWVRRTGRIRATEIDLTEETRP